MTSIGKREKFTYLTPLVSITTKFYNAPKFLIILLFFANLAKAAATYSDNSTNSTLAGTPVEHRLNWQDAVGLSGYIFSFNNGSNWTDGNCGDYATQQECEPWGCTWIGEFCDGTADSCASHVTSETCGYDAGCEWSIPDAVLNMTLITTYQDNSGAGSIEGARGMQIDSTRKLAFISANTDDYLTALNYSDPSSITVFGSITDTSPPGSIDGIYYGTLDSVNNIFYAPSSTDDATSWYDVTTSTFVLLGNTSADTFGSGSQEEEYDVVYVDTGSTRWLITGGRADSYVSSFNVTGSPVRPTVVGSFTDTSGACSVEGMYDLYNIPGTSYVLVAATVDSRVTLLSISAAGAITCIGSGYTDTSGSGSIEGLQSFYYETSTGYLYVPSPTDGYLTILTSIATGTPTLVGSVGGLTTPVSVTVGTVGSEKYAFVGSSTAGMNTTVINVTDATNPAILSVFSQTSGTCVYNGVYSLYVEDNYLFATSAVDYCFYSIKLYDIPTYVCSGTPDACGTYNASQTNCERVSCDWNPEECSGTPNYEFKNDTWVPFTSEMCPTAYTDCWSNVTKYVNTTVGAFIKWCVYANDTSNVWTSSCSPPYNYTTTINYYSSSTNLCGYYQGSSASCGAANNFCAVGTYYPTQACSASPTYTSCQAVSSSASCAICGDCAGGSDTCNAVTCGTTNSYGCGAGQYCNGGKGAGSCNAPFDTGVACNCSAQCTSGVCSGGTCQAKYQSGTNLCGYYTGSSSSCGAANNFCAVGTYYPTQACSASPTYTSCQAESTSSSCDTCGDCVGGADTCGAAACGTTYGCAGGNVCNGQGTGAGNCVAPGGPESTCYCDAMCTGGSTCISNLCTSVSLSFTVTIPRGGTNYTSLNSTPGTETGRIYFNITTANQKEVNPCVDEALTNCQTSAIPIFRFWNTGTTTETWTMILSTLPQMGLVLWGNSSGNSTPSVFDGALKWTVNNSIPTTAGSNWVDAWLYVNATGATASTADRYLNHSTTE